MAFGNATFTDAAGAVSDLLSSQATADGLRLKAKGDIVEGQNYLDASTLARQNQEYTAEFTAMKQTMADRQIYQGIGTETAQIAGAGFAQSGSALDLLRDSAAQGALQKEIIAKQGAITEAGYNEQATAYHRLSDFANYSASVDEKAADTAVRNGEITAGIKGAAAVATLFV